MTRDPAEILPEWEAGKASPGVRAMFAVAAEQLRPPMITVDEVEQAARLLRAHGLRRQAHVFDVLLSEGRTAATSLLPATRRKRSAVVASARKERKTIYLALRDRLDPNHTDSLLAVYNAIEDLLTKYRDGNWKQHSQRRVQPSRGMTECDDLLWRLSRLKGLQTNRVNYDLFRKPCNSILR